MRPYLQFKAVRGVPDVEQFLAALRDTPRGIVYTEHDDGKEVTISHGAGEFMDDTCVVPQSSPPESVFPRFWAHVVSAWKGPKIQAPNKFPLNAPCSQCEQ